MSAGACAIIREDDPHAASASVRTTTSQRGQRPLRPHDSTLAPEALMCLTSN